MNARKVIEMGEGTLLVSLPKDWTRRNGVKKGATMAVEELSGRKLLVRPIEDTEDRPGEFDVEYTGEDLAQVIDVVTGAYLLGFGVIRISAKKVIPREDRAALKAMIGRLVGLEVMDEDSKRITVQFLLEPSAIVPEKIVRRMSGLLDGMLRDTSEAVLKRDAKLLGLVGERDDEVDRLYFLLVRATRTAIVRPELAEGYGLSPVDVLDYRVLATFLESAGDAVTELANKLLGARPFKELSTAYSDCILKLVEMNELATQSFLSRRPGRPRSYNSRLNATMSELRKGIKAAATLQEAERPAAAEALASIERIGLTLADISDLAVTAQQVR